MAVIDISMDYPTDCWDCKNRINEISDDYGSRCECSRTGTKIDLLLHQKPSDCPLKEVPSGKWIRHNARFGGGTDHIECSYCGTWYQVWNMPRNSYCPNCGAKMVEKNEN